MKAIILNHQASAVEVITIPQEIEREYYEQEEDSEVVYEYLMVLDYEPFVQFMLVDEDCPIYDCSEESQDKQTPIYVIR